MHRCLGVIPFEVLAPGRQLSLAFFRAANQVNVALREGNRDVRFFEGVEYLQIGCELNGVVILGFDPVAVSDFYGRVPESLDTDLRRLFPIDS